MSHTDDPINGLIPVADGGSQPDGEQPTLPEHERIYRQAMAHLATIDEQWARALEQFADRGQQK